MIVVLLVALCAFSGKRTLDKAFKQRSKEATQHGNYKSLPQFEVIAVAPCCRPALPPRANCCTSSAAAHCHPLAQHFSAVLPPRPAPHASTGRCFSSVRRVHRSPFARRARPQSAEGDGGAEQSATELTSVGGAAKSGDEAQRALAREVAAESGCPYGPVVSLLRCWMAVMVLSLLKARAKRKERPPPSHATGWRARMLRGVTRRRQALPGVAFALPSRRLALRSRRLALRVATSRSTQDLLCALRQGAFLCCCRT